MIKSEYSGEDKVTATINSIVVGHGTFDEMIEKFKAHPEKKLLCISHPQPWIPVGDSILQ